WPISGLRATIVIVLSGAIETYALSVASVPPAAVAALAIIGIEALSISPPPASAPAFSSVRRERATVSGIGRSLLRHHGDRVVDAGVAGAAADIAGHRLVDLLRARLWVASEQRSGVHQLPGLAIAALHHVLVHPGLLQRPADRALAQGFDRRHLLVADRADWQRARTGRDAIDMDGTSPAQADAATELGPDHAQLVPQRPQQRHVFRHVELAHFAVDLDPIGHAILLVAPYAEHAPGGRGDPRTKVQPIVKHAIACAKRFANRQNCRKS